MYRLIRELLFLLDAEEAHEFTARQMIALQQIPIVLRAISRLCAPPASAAREILGMRFPSPIGIAAGFDKNALMMPMLAALGFGFVEVGTVTLRPQPGNPRPRLFRVPESRALINRMGFNNDGADVVAQRLAQWRAGVRHGAAVPYDGCRDALVRHGCAVPNPAPLFVNIGKNRDVPLEGVAEAYAACAAKLAPYADAIVVNVSSPNTPSLRELQRPEHLSAIIRAIDATKPLFVKIAPDVDDALLVEICDVCVKHASGMICTNTTAHEQGGLSGAPLMEKSTRILARVRELVGAGYPLIGVGGVFSRDDVRAKMAAGADLVQAYTGFVYGGPMFASRVAKTMNDER